MDSFAEQAVAMFLTRGGKFFIAPQYAIPAPGEKKDWACPDFVALDFDKTEVVVVEVSTASNIDALLDKVDNRDFQWFSKLREKFESENVPFKNWNFRFLGFVRKEVIGRARNKFVGQTSVAFHELESATFPWEYWNIRTQGLPK